MAGKKRKLITALCVVVGLVVVASVVLRLVLTRERLTGLVVPRIEKALGAKIEIGDIGIRFPFGFGVDIRDLDVNKHLPEGGRLSVFSSRVTVRMSLVSLVRRRPRIDKVELGDAVVGVMGTGRGMDVLLRGLEIALSVRPVDYGYSINSSIAADSVFLSVPGGGKAITLEDIRFRGRMESDSDFDSLRLEESELDWGRLMTVRLSGEIDDLKRQRYFSIQVESRDNDAAPLVERLLSLPLEEIPALKAGGAYKDIPVGLSEGKFSIDSKVEGSMRMLSDMDVSGRLGLKGISIKHAAVEQPFTLNGEIDFSRGGVKADGLRVVFGRSKADIGFGIDISENRKVESAGFDIELELDLEDLASFRESPDLALTGKVMLDLEGRGAPIILKSLFPTGAGDLTPGKIAHAWKSVMLKGVCRAEGVSLSAGENPVELSSLEAEAEINRGDIDNVKSEFSLNGSASRLNASMKGVMPALAEMVSVYKSGSPPSALGRFLDSIENVPDISLELSLRSFDARPFEKPASEKQAVPGQERRGGGDDAPGKATPGYLAANPLLPLVLKKTSFTAGIDSIISGKAIFTDIRAMGTILDGRLRADNILMDYAGGKGAAGLRVDLRNPDRIITKISLTLDGVEAGRALGRMHKMGNLVEGRFSFESKGELFNSPGVNPLNTLSASGSAASSMGRITIAQFMSHISNAAGLDLSRLESFDFNEWSGGFIIESGRLKTDDWKIRSRSGNWSIRGSFGFDGTIDYAVRLVIPPGVQKEMKDLRKYRDLVDLFMDREGNLVLDFILGGTARSPKVSLDSSAAAKKAGEKLLDGLKKKAQDLFKKK